MKQVYDGSEEGGVLHSYLTFRRALMLGAAILFLRSAIVLYLGDNEHQRVIVDDIIWPVVNGLAALSLFRAARATRSLDERMYIAWAFFAVAQMLYALGDVLWSILEVGLGETPFPSVADGPYLAYYFFFLVGILLLPATYQSAFERLKSILDTGIVTIFAIIVFWSFLIAPTIATLEESDPLANAIAVAYPVADLVLTFSIIALIFRRIEHIAQRPIMLLAASAVFMIVADSMFMVEALRETYVPATLKDSFWLISYILTGLAGVLQVESVGVPVKRSAERPSHGFTWPLYLPYICAISAYAFLIWSMEQEDVNLYIRQHHLAAGVGMIILLIVIRQVIAIKENTMLYAAAQKELHQRIASEREKELLIKELEAKTSEMERFIYTVSHDLRSPLITVSGFLGFLRDDIEKGAWDKVRKDIEILESAVTKMDRLLQDTLELSRIGRMMNPPEDVPFSEIVREALEQTSERIRSRGVTVDVAEDLPVVHVDRMRAVEALVNLIENSAKYMGDQREPRIEIGCISDGETVFYVKDNGIGIDPKNHQKIFELFYKVDNRSEGTGAGLAIVKRIIEVHGGRIWIESELGKGCTVFFTLPLSEKS
ncbi:MAG: HAMP domain-containing sensor histidine kinase [Methanothrix sp.]|jgi:signal transduction histidine kinase|uniref:sensor histidine kinase n=1 Tax=Methanothrix sp. TaxID=90426 RepID=UPI00247BA33D|nr:HAMP domain-containing sensor histidine kinase [Methanothrix sp.]